MCDLMFFDFFVKLLDRNIGVRRSMAKERIGATVKTNVLTSLLSYLFRIASLEEDMADQRPWRPNQVTTLARITERLLMEYALISVSWSSSSLLGASWKKDEMKVGSAGFQWIN